MRRLSVIAVLLLAAGDALGAARSVSLLGVSGVGGAHFAELLEQDLGELYDLVPAEVYRRTAERLDKRGASPEEVQAVTAYIRIDALLAGTITGEGRGRKLVLVVREGATGRVIARGRYDLSGRTLPLVREKVMSELVRVLDRVRPQPPRGQTLAATPAEPGEEEPSPAEPGETESLPTVTRSAAKSELTWRGVFAGVGPTLMTRSLGFDQASAPGYSGGTVAGIRADGAVFPLALSAELAEAHPALASFGFVGSYQHVFGFTSTTATGSSEAHASRWYVLFVGRIPLGHGARGGTLQLETGFQEITWGSKSPQDIGVPDVTYDLVDGGMTWEKTLGTRALVLGVRAAFQGLVGAGEIASYAQYGPVGGWGLDLDVGLTVWPTRWLWLRLDGRYTPLLLSFPAAGARFAHSATDQFVDGLLEVGFAL
jgi:hypothetical protein